MSLRRRKSITFRLTLLFASVSTAVLLLLGVMVGALVERHFEVLDRELLTSRLELIQHALARVRSPEGFNALSAELNDALASDHGLGVFVAAADGHALFLTDGPRLPDTLLRGKSSLSGTRPVVWRDPENHLFRGIAALARTGIAGDPPVFVALSTDISQHEHFMRSFRSTLWTVVAAAALLTGVLGWLAARSGLAPLREMRRKAAEVTASQLDRRLSVAAVPVELSELAETLNDMLARLEESFRRLSDFSSDLAHELRTPLSNLLIETQVILSKARTAEEYRDVLASNEEEFERLSRMISDMLFLAKADNNMIIPHREPVDLMVEAQELHEFYEALLEEKDIRYTCAGSGTVSGDRLMLRRAINNLLSNAVRHTPSGGQVTVRVDDSNKSVVTVSVENSGETIAPDELPRLFNRFYRAHASGRHLDEGTGLGLAITRSIARAHGGDASVRSKDGITRFELRIPSRRSLAESKSDASVVHGQK